MSVVDDKPEPQTTTAPQLDLVALYPDCFNLSKPRPLKIGIRQDLLAAGHDLKTLRCVIGALSVRIAVAVLISKRCKPEPCGLTFRDNLLVK
ncbi:ProQ/FINO family protein [Chromatium okenii]|uniref:ProQ/FINO family protein n=1 Tax=Chromatium okenii TaxID=61644 RepID=UPI0026EE70C2|nr:ProQ/FINO family protein [Chromatium okenii]MBV5311581.1 hypothetical protein [Chromatium okenii]